MDLSKLKNLCSSCPILGTANQNFDYATILGPADILFVSDTFKYNNQPFSKDEKPEIVAALGALGNIPETIEFTASIKCPNIREGSLTAAAKKACREHLANTIRIVKPKLVFACGNLAFNMLTKKSGINKYRGEIFTYVVDDFETKVCPIFHPFSVVREPSNQKLFQIDVKNAYDKVIKQIDTKIVIPYEIIKDPKQLDNYSDIYESDIVSCDLETEDFDFEANKILTVGFSYESKGQIRTLVIPYEHKEHNWGDEFPKIWYWINEVLSDINIVKFFHNAKFDLKFLLANGFTPNNVECSKNLAKYLNENRPNRLRDLVKEYFGVVLC